MRQLKIEKSITNRDTSSLNTYFTEISNQEMVTAEEEVELAQRIHKGDETALEKLVTANLRFVVSVAKQYQHLGVGLSDLINEGNIGLVKAAQKFDETKGFKFISYAVWWIRQSIHSAIQNHGKIVRLPANKVGLLMKIRRAEEDFVQHHERLPGQEELAEILGVKTSQVKSAVEAAPKASSLDEPLSNDESSTKGDLFVPENSNNVEHAILSSSFKEDVQRLLSRLDPNERLIIKRFFGIDSRAKSLSEIADELNLSKERIRQIKLRVIGKLRKSAKPYMFQ